MPVLWSTEFDSVESCREFIRAKFLLHRQSWLKGPDYVDVQFDQTEFSQFAPASLIKYQTLEDLQSAVYKADNSASSRVRARDSKTVFTQEEGCHDLGVFDKVV